MRQFYISEQDYKRCNESMISNQPIRITGLMAEGAIKLFTGIVHSVEEDTARTGSRRWRVTMRDTDSR